MDDLTVLADAYKALAHPVRLAILNLLRDGECCVCHIQAQLALPQAYISQHLNVLRRAGLVSSRKEGLRMYYQVTSPLWFECHASARQALAASGRRAVDLIQATPVKQHCDCPACREAVQLAPLAAKES
jgi:DNA-binding transcriptional ArsR family regulator